MRTKTLICLVACLIFSFLCSCNDDSLGNWGEFDGSVKAEWLDPPENRKMKLLEDLKYTDPHGKAWISKKDDIVDGATIPQFLWSFIGSPFVGEYRNASVVHDTACKYNQVEGKETWESVHKMFYEACRCCGVSEVKAQIMYWAVCQFGPHWEIVEEVDPVDSSRRIRTTRPSASLSMDRNLRDLVKAKKLDKDVVFTGRRIPGTADALLLDREEIDRDRVNRDIENYFTTRKPTLAEIKTLSLEEVLGDRE